MQGSIEINFFKVWIPVGTGHRKESESDYSFVCTPQLFSLNQTTDWPPKTTVLSQKSNGSYTPEPISLKEM